MEVPLIPLKVYQDFPGDLKNLLPHQVRDVFPAPSLIEIEGRRKQPLFISTLLHGNESTSFYVLRRLQDYLRNHELPRSVILFVGNVFAAQEKVRFLPDQKDYNRIWDSGESAEHQLANAVKNHVSGQGSLFASIDIHNNTGTNPFYSCISNLEPQSIYLSSLFSRTLVYFKSPKSAQSVVFTDLCPSVTLECGKSDNFSGIDKAFNFVLDILHLETLDHPVNPQEIDIYETKLRLVIQPGIDFSFGGNSSLVFRKNFEKLNFQAMPQGEKFADFTGSTPPFSALDVDGNNCFDNYFKLEKGSILLREPLIPSMFTKNKNVIRQDCLGYLMKQISR